MSSDKIRDNNKFIGIRTTQKSQILEVLRVESQQTQGLLRVIGVKAFQNTEEQKKVPRVDHQQNTEKRHEKVVGLEH